MLISKKKVNVIVQARSSSSRFPGKSLVDINGLPLIIRVLNQLKGSKLLNDIILATSEDVSDNTLSETVQNSGFNVFRGSLDDVLSRYYNCAKAYNSDVIVRVTGDCPLISHDTIDDVIQFYLNNQFEYVSNTFPYSRPEGQDVEIFSFNALNLAYETALNAFDREHVTPWIRRNDGFEKFNYIHKAPHLDARWSVDYPEDVKLITSIWSSLDSKGKFYHNFEEIYNIFLQMENKTDNKLKNEGTFISIFNEAPDTFSDELVLQKSQELLKRSLKTIPGGAQTYSKSYKHHINGVSPIFLDKGKGSVVIDVDGNAYIDLIQGLLPNILGYANEEVNNAVLEQSKYGHSFSLAHPIEVELAEKLCSLIPCAEMVRFGKNGSDATAGAVRIARAYTQRDHVAVCGYHGWQDWYIGSTSKNAGVPKAVCDLVHKFDYNDINSLEKIFIENPNTIAAVILEPFNFFLPQENFLEKVKELAHAHGALLIFDEICSGFHFGLGGAQKLFNVKPDLAAFGKAMGNGWPISCIVGRKDVMQTFDDAFVSFTFAGDVAAMAGALKVISILERETSYKYLEAVGTKICDGARVFAKLSGVDKNFKLDGHTSWSVFNFVDNNEKDDLYMRAVWLQEVTRRGVLVLTTFNMSLSLTEGDVLKVLNAFASAFKILGKIKDSGKEYKDYLKGQLPIPAFKVR